MIDISVIIPVYNAGPLIKRCLDSVLAQKGDYTYEVLLIDDGSTDDSVEIIKSYNNTKFKIFQQKNAGPATARNKGIKEAQGKYITFLDADDYWENTFFEETISFLSKNTECVAVSVVCKNITISGICYNPSLYTNCKERCCVKNELRELEYTPFILKDFYRYWAHERHVGTCSTTINSMIAKQISMRKDLRVTEDYEFWFLLAIYGKWGIVPKPLYVSDGTDIVRTQEDWLAKMKRRWENAPSIEDWQKRIVERKPNIINDMGYKYAIGRVSRNLTYCQLLSGRIKLARSEAKKYGKYFPKDTIGRLMNFSKHTSLTWRALCKLLKYREYHRM